MLVQEKRVLRAQALAEDGTTQFMVALPVAPDPSIIITLPDYTAEETPPSVTIDPGENVLGTAFTFSALYKATMGGLYRVLWLFKKLPDEERRMEDLYFAAYSDVWGIVRSRTSKTFSSLTDETIDRELADVVRDVSYEFGVNYYDIDDPEDQVNFDYAAALFVALKITGFFPASESTGPVTRVKQGDVEYYYRTANTRDMKISANTGNDWYAEGIRALARIPVIGAQLNARARKKVFLQMSRGDLDVSAEFG